jgi:hypothetical protein
VPAGNPDGGQWTSDGEGSEGHIQIVFEAEDDLDSYRPTDETLLRSIRGLRNDWRRQAVPSAINDASIFATLSLSVSRSREVIAILGIFIGA